MFITHLQFACDTIIFLKPGFNCIISIKISVKAFELILGLEVNLGKSYVAGIYHDEGYTFFFVDPLGCKVRIFHSNILVSRLVEVIGWEASGIRLLKRFRNDWLIGDHPKSPWMVELLS